ncbi:DUF2975 domain-containing protein [Paenibacillus thiaminolyticus]|uniref:DUF2975 domain-containing protein n=2 Tax=Paenibacillus thiaminolyticus TaxID=49283 RepID=A0AAP9DXI9_PANTH|nr:DUF2975 domain-containing protein [Paenibacillus thiaminolyticus]MCY9534183.1 DUF2975 domain-containing protein [Paenibacillus thiaminolyticus]MCY9604702.1 DUF2975 domain-containing protein [Paenibacillus thiaminolyticus]MCY9610139.1 DUF2975 domain-containing protein [Paenibacillus thiaminolyticus]MCY9614648.1 DUF2975 domain-containing protein [Paenibacillus thiaminolyticus]MCY9621833.1 DUF2975 domain-containing protein [Paenibacillus thiaminolyticus]
MLRGQTAFLKLAIAMIGITALILSIFWLPGFVTSRAAENPDYISLKYPVLIVVYMTSIPFYIALYQSYKLLQYIERKHAFSDLAVASLKRIKQCAVAIAIIYAIGGAFLGFQSVLLTSIALIGAVIILAAFTVAIFAAVLQELLTHALAIKSENDLTV